MDNLIVQLVPQHLGNMRGTASFNLLYLFGRIVCQTPGKNCPIFFFTDRNNIAFTKRSLHRYNARGKQAFPLLCQGMHGAIIDIYLSLWLDCVSYPPFTAFLFFFFFWEKGGHNFSLQNFFLLLVRSSLFHNKR